MCNNLGHWIVKVKALSLKVDTEVAGLVFVVLPLQAKQQFYFTVSGDHSFRIAQTRKVVPIVV